MDHPLPNAVSRGPDQLDVFFCASDGSVYTSAWPVAGGEDWSGLWRNITDGMFPAQAPAWSNAPVTAVSRNPGQLDVFVCSAGQVWTTAWSAGNDWNAWRTIGGPPAGDEFGDTAFVNVVDRDPMKLDVFVIGTNGHLYTTAWPVAGGSDWSGAWRDLGGAFPPWARTSAVCRSPLQIDLFGCGKDGRVYTTAWAGGGDWNGWTPISPGGGNPGSPSTFNPGSPVSAVSRDSEQLDAFVCGSDGRVYTAAWAGGGDWNGLEGWEPISPGGLAANFPPGAPVSVVSRNPEQLDAFVCASDGRVYTAAWAGGGDWNGLQGWEPISPQVHLNAPSGFAPAAPLSVVSRDPLQLDVFTGGFDGNVYTSAWAAGSDWSGRESWRNIGGATITPPAEGLVSDDNYFLDDDGNTLVGVLVDVLFTSDFISTANGFSFQLNCYSKEGADITTEWQQYIIYAHPGDTQLWARVNNWAGTTLAEEVMRVNVPLANLPTPNPQDRYLFEIGLRTDDDDYVTAAEYTVLDDKGKQLGTTVIVLTDNTLRSHLPVTKANLAPIVAFTFNIGGDFGGSAATLSSGSGIITYQATNPLTVVSTEPTYTMFDDGTAETANLVFQALPPTRGQRVTQTFSYVGGDRGRALVKHHEGHQLPPP